MQANFEINILDLSIAINNEFMNMIVIRELKKIGNLGFSIF
jgi:predicted amino acid-binding ACT domain protein